MAVVLSGVVVREARITQPKDPYIYQSPTFNLFSRGCLRTAKSLAVPYTNCAVGILRLREMVRSANYLTRSAWQMR
jgi:hypothetical protein